MRLFKDKKGQSILEYALLLGVVIAAILIMQVFVKRGFQGGIKDSADKMGEQFSAGGTAISQDRITTGTQKIEETTAGNTVLQAFARDAKNTIDSDAYSVSERSGGTTQSTLKQQTDSSAKEKFKWSEYQTTEAEDFPAPF